MKISDVSEEFEEKPIDHNRNKAMDILRQIQDHEIIIKPNAELWIADEVADVLKYYQNRTTMPLSKAFVNRVFTIHNILVSRGLIYESDSQNDELLKKKDKEINDLKLKLAKLQGIIEERERTDIPDDTELGDVGT